MSTPDQVIVSTGGTGLAPLLANKRYLYTVVTDDTKRQRALVEWPASTLLRLNNDGSIEAIHTGESDGSVPINPISQDTIDDPRTREIRRYTQNWINSQIAIETRLRDTRAEFTNAKNFLHGDTLSETNLATIAEIERKARFRAAARAVGAALELEEGATSEDGDWPLLSDFAIQALSPFWTDGVAIGSINGLSAALSGKTSPAAVDAQIQAFYDGVAPETLSLLTQLATDLENHESMEATILAAVSAEQAARIVDVDAEEAARILGDTANANAITAEIASRSAADTTENSRAIAAENTVQAFAIQRANHTGTQAASTISDFSAATLLAVTWSTLTGKPTFATVATSGSYADLTNKPTIPANPVIQDLSVSTNFTITPTAGAAPTKTISYVTSSVAGVLATIGETGIAKGSELRIINVGSNSFIMQDTSGVSESSGNFTIGPNDVIEYLYGTDRWFEVGRSNN